MEQNKVATGKWPFSRRARPRAERIRPFSRRARPRTAEYDGILDNLGLGNSKYAHILDFRGLGLRNMTVFSVSEA